MSYGATPSAPADAHPASAARSSRSQRAAEVTAVAALILVVGAVGRAPARSRTELRRADNVYSSGATYYGPNGETSYPSEPLGDDLVQLNWPGLQCVLDDDDQWEWGADDSVMGCVAGDSWTCLEYNLTGRTQAMCGDACNATDEYIIELSQRTGKNISSLGGMVGHSFLAVCEWEMIRSLPKTCNSTFTNYLPTAASNNEQPSYPNVTWMQTNMYFNGSKWDMCNIHGARRGEGGGEAPLRARCTASHAHRRVSARPVARCAPCAPPARFFSLLLDVLGGRRHAEQALRGRHAEVPVVEYKEPGRRRSYTERRQRVRPGQSHELLVHRRSPLGGRGRHVQRQAHRRDFMKATDGRV